jgi:hypothetical protein
MPGVKLLKVVRNKTGLKKFTAVFLRANGTEKRVKFGAKGYSDYTIHKDRARRERYRQRHKKDLATRDATRPGFLSWHILWGDSTNLNANIRAYRRLLSRR